MNYTTIQMGSLYLNDCAQHIPQNPSSDIPDWEKNATIKIGDTASDRAITWIKPANMNLLIADRVLLCNVSWDALNAEDLVYGKKITIDGIHYLCRLLKVGNQKDVPNEWDELMDIAGGNNSPLHYLGIRFWGQESPSVNMGAINTRATRGAPMGRGWASFNSSVCISDVGFRPVLEPLSAYDLPEGKRINLEGQDFLLTHYEGAPGFRPILYPLTSSRLNCFDPDVFGSIPVGTKIKMYTLLEGCKPSYPGGYEIPVHINGASINLTDKFCGDEYLITWTIVNGVAVADNVLLIGVTPDELKRLCY